MAVKIRLKRMGKKGTPFYRLVVVDSRWRRDGKTIEDIGWYDPVKNPVQLSIKEEKVYQWLDKGAQMSETARSLLKNQGFLKKYRTGEYKEVLEKMAQANLAPVTSSAIPKVEKAPAKVEASLAPAEEAKSEE
jgi:small subunit ribosomal protein S16